MEIVKVCAFGQNEKKNKTTAAKNQDGRKLFERKVQHSKISFLIKTDKAQILKSSQCSHVRSTDQ